MKKLFIFTSLALIVSPQIASAHSFGILYNLPVPFWMYLYGGVAAMLVSFLFIGYFFDKKAENAVGTANFAYPKKDLYKFSFFRFLTNGQFIKVLRFISIFLFLLTILSGVLGQDSSYSNFNMTFFWIIFTLGFTYATALLGNVYNIINPWKILTDYLIGTKEEPMVAYPKSWGYYPALIFYFIFIWVELFGETTPLKLSLILLAYTIINDLGVIAFGKDVWYKYCEFFSVFFRLIGKISPLEYKEGKLYLRPPFIGLLKQTADHFSMLLFVLFMLSSTAFDGFRETIVLTRFYWSNLDDFIRPILGSSSYLVFQSIALFLSLFVFLGIYLFLIYLAKNIAQSTHSLKDLASQFAFSLIPIAFVYNIAHYFTLIFTEGPNAIRLLSDPFGFGWNLLNTADYSSAFIPGANFVWHAQVALILVGHIVGVYLTHVVALNVFSSTTTKRAFWSQFPMLCIMIAFTMIGLWILAQPITGGTL